MQPVALTMRVLREHPESGLRCPTDLSVCVCDPTLTVTRAARGAANLVTQSYALTAATVMMTIKM